MRVEWDFKYCPGQTYEWEAYYSPQRNEFWSFYEWCSETFGPPGDRWDYDGGWVMFHTRSDVDWFLLKWS